tara:strand:+ start:837 stop:1151 length:315 start_codon:yes stop_codon:yes gene_type:complete
MKVYVDIDETICFYKGERNYKHALPIDFRIKKINKMYDEGCEITYWTARGSITGKDWFDVTRNQLNEWGCKYHNLSVGEKPPYDLLICDKVVNSEVFFAGEENE